MARRKWYKGTPPKNGRALDFYEGWELWEFDTVEADKWENNETPWLNLKVITIEPNDRKANYYIAISNERFAATRDWQFLQEHADRGVIAWLEEFRLSAVAERKRKAESE